MRVLITGVAGFIGFSLAHALLQEGHAIKGIDNLNDYYDIKLKEDRLELLAKYGSRFDFSKVDLADAGALDRVFKDSEFTHVINLAAQAGVRYSLEHPSEYIQSNLVGFANLLESCRHAKVEHLIYASSSSVYGMNENWPYSPHHNVDHPVSLYAATKKSNEAMAHAYSHLWGLPATGLRFFTVYGPWGRPDMALFKFTDAIIHDKPIKLFNNGELLRDFTYIDDIVKGIRGVMNNKAAPNPDFDPVNPDPASSTAPWRLYNIGNNHTVPLTEFVSELENALGKKAMIEYLPMQPGDVKSTWADVSDLEALTGFAPATPLKEGIKRYVAWHKEYYSN